MRSPRRLSRVGGLLILALVLAVAEGSEDWPQDAHDAQRSGFTPKEPTTPWSFAWAWNGPDEQGGTGGHRYDAPREARVIIGNDRVFVPAGPRGLFALDRVTGHPVWEAAGDYQATPAFDRATGRLYAGTADGRIYAFDPDRGDILATTQSRGAIRKSVLFASGCPLVVTDSGILRKLDPNTMSDVWTYEARSSAATPPAWSATRDLVVFATEDLFVHAVAMKDGKPRWRIKPTAQRAGFPHTYEGGWPVIADRAGLVFMRMRLDHNPGLWGGPGPRGIYPDTNAKTRAFLDKRPDLKNLFALRLDDGREAFTPAVGYGGVEGLIDGKPFLHVGSMPVIRTTPEGKDVAYVPFRNGQGRPPDGRWDSHLGEMVLDADTLPGLAAGDLRFVEFPNSHVKITDEQVPQTMAGDTIFRAHWGASEAIRLLDRGAERGQTFADPIKTRAHPVVIRRQRKSPNFDPTTHWTTDGLTLFGDGRYWDGPGWWVYWDVLDPPTPARDAYSDGLRPRYTIVGGGLILVQGNGGELFALRHAGPSR